MTKLKMLMAALVCTVPALAQNVSTPYSMYGYGILGDRATSMQRQMGGVGYAMNSGRQINVMNPASYAAIDSLTFLFDMGADLSFIWSQEGDAKEKSTGGGLDYLTMQFPISKYLGGSVGLLPYSSVGYAFGNDISHGTMENQGSGGINELYLGLSGKIKGFSIGFNVSYDFGNIVNDVFANPSSGSTKFEHVMKVRDWNIVLGAQYTQKIGRYDRFVLGATYSPKKTLLGTTWATIQETTQESTPTEVARMSLKNHYYTPNSVGAGISYTHERVSRFNVEFDYTWQGWKDCRYSPLYSIDNPEVVVFNGMEFNNRSRYAAGAEYVPKLRGSYMQRAAYRLGAYYTDDYLKIHGNGVREYGVTAGVGFPTVEGKTMINLGFEWKMRQAHPQALLKENYFNITLGVNFNEVWFFKRKIR
jgi:hypothetical protein